MFNLFIVEEIEEEEAIMIAGVTLANLVKYSPVKYSQIIPLNLVASTGRICVINTVILSA